MSDDAAHKRISDPAVQALRDQNRRRQLLLDGASTPSPHDTWLCMPPYKGSPALQLGALAGKLIASDKTATVKRLARRLEGSPTAEVAMQLHAAVHDQRVEAELVWMSTLLGHQTARELLIKDLLSRMPRGDVDGVRRFAVAFGMLWRWSDQDNGNVEALVDSGLFALRGLASMVAEHDSAVAALIGEQTSDVLDVLERVTEDRAEIDDDEDDVIEPVLGVRAALVVPALDASKATGWRKEIYKSWSEWAGSMMPLVQRGDVAAHRRALVDRWPHAAGIIDTILGDLAARENVRFRPTLLVGPPGSGKSALMRAIAETVGLPVELQGMAGLHDAALMGTSAQWSSARESAPLQLIKRSGKANPAMIWDEIEKASQSRTHGAPAEALLPMLEIEQARHYRDLCLEVECDLSWISHFATANSVDGIPDPVRDRMRVLVMPTPGWQHLGVLVGNIVAGIAAERGIDPRWLAPLAEDELDLVRAAWPGGSIRQLQRIVTTVVDGRDALIGRA